MSFPQSQTNVLKRIDSGLKTAGMTDVGTGMTDVGTGMTDVGTGMTDVGTGMTDWKVGH